MNGLEVQPDFSHEGPWASGYGKMLEPVPPPKVLIVEDDELMRTALIRLIERSPTDFECVGVGSWEAACKEIQHSVPDLLITDFYLDEGRTAVDLLRRTASGPLLATDCLVISGGTPLPSLFAAEREGLRIKFMKKPVDRGLLERFLQFDLDPGYYL